jgi:polysaccharide export outer membrane protein
LWGEEALSKTVPVRIDGKISVPLIDDIQAEGHAPLQLKKLLTKRFTKLIAHTTLSLIAKETNSFKASVLGEVKLPGVQRLKSKTSLLQLIAIAGGFTEWANRKEILLIRKENGNN